MSAIHPEIGALIRNKEQMWELLEKGRFEPCLRKMKRLLLDIRDKDRDQKLYNAIDHELNFYKYTRSQKRRTRRAMKYSKHYWDWGNRIVQVLWNKGYLIEKTYRPERKSSKMSLKNKP